MNIRSQYFMLGRTILYLVFIEYCVISKILKYIPDSGLSRFPLGVSVCTQCQVKNQSCSRTGRVQKNHNISRKNTIFNERPVYLKHYRGISVVRFLILSLCNKFLRSFYGNYSFPGLSFLLWLDDASRISVALYMYLIILPLPPQTVCLTQSITDSDKRYPQDIAALKSENTQTVSTFLLDY